MATCDKDDTNMEEEGHPPSPSHDPVKTRTPPWVDGDVAAALLRAGLEAAVDVLGSAEVASICQEYLKPQDALATVRRVTVTRACVASVPGGGGRDDVFVPASVLPGNLVPEVGSRLRVSMVTTSTGRSAFLAISASEAEDDGWCVASSKRKRGGAPEGGDRRRSSVGEPPRRPHHHDRGERKATNRRR